MTEDYRATVFLPRTDFPMKAGLAQKEPAILERWRAIDLYGRLRRERAGRTRYILHDGPPYANGDIHVGHAQNKILKDMVVRFQSLMGKDAPFVPGWDCHGLPIEWKVEEGYRARKQDKDQVPVGEFRAQCRDYAAHWVAVQSEQFQRLGVMGDWANPYLTMNFAAEATIAAELLKFAESGQLYRGAKPVMWSPVEKTALADAEVEYEDITSTQIDVGFTITESARPELIGAQAVIWTTTPWTIPVNQALAYAPGTTYALVALPAERGDDGAARRVLIAADLVPAFLKRLGERGAGGHILSTIEGKALAGAVAQHPMHALGDVFYQRPRPFLAGDFVTTDAGTGLVHMAPDHGEDDFLLCKAHGIDPVFAVGDDGRYRTEWPWLGGNPLSVINPRLNAPEGPICADLRAANALLAATADYRHSYPHSWRSKAKVIQRCTPQWFIAIDRPLDGPADTLRARALTAIGETRWLPAKGENRITAMVEGRPDWVVSRQRAWGVPIALYVHRKSGEMLIDPAVNARILAAFRARGADAWFDADHAALLGPDHDVHAYEPVRDILDVWFDSGSTHAFVVEARYGVGTRADLYLEGSDQHRGWFQSSLLESCGTRGRAPYQAVMTHGFALDGQGRKMSKSIGNVIDPLKVIQTSGADILRLWVASTDTSEDVRISNEILSGASDAYRKLRNTFRYLLGALDGYGAGEAVPPAAMPELERYLLDRLAMLDAELRAALDGLEFARYTRALVDFANIDLSAFFFDIRKDVLYCDAVNAPRRRAYRTVLDHLFHALVRYAAPILPFTTEEVWGTRHPDDDGSVHLLEWPAIDADWRDVELATRWAAIREVRARITDAIEPLRRDKVIGSSLAADVVLDGLDPILAGAINLAEIAIVASVACGDATRVTPTTQAKCGRCWRHLPEVAEDGALCNRCEAVVA